MRIIEVEYILNAFVDCVLHWSTEFTLSLCPKHEEAEILVFEVCGSSQHTHIAQHAILLLLSVISTVLVQHCRTKGLPGLANLG